MLLSDQPSASLLCATILLLGTAFLPRPTLAQIELRVGVREGGNFATLRGGDRTQVATPRFSEDPATLSQRPGLILGGLVQLDPTGPMAVQSEALWIWKGVTGTVTGGETATKLNYLELPVLAKYRLPVSWGPITGHLVAGPTFGLVTQAERTQTTDDAEGGTRLVSRTNLVPAARTLDVGVTVGGEVGYRFGYRARMMLGLRYRRSLTRTFSGPAGAEGEGPTPNVRHQGLALTLGFVYTTGWTFSID